MYVAPPPPLPELLKEVQPELLAAGLTRTGSAANGPLVEGKYIHWDKLRHLNPPPGLDHRQWWAQLKLSRVADMRYIPLLSTDGREFSYCLPDLVLQHLHQIDKSLAGEVAMEHVVTSERLAGRRFLVNSLREEAIRSSQLEGATTSLEDAQELLRSGREPRDQGERMIANNFRALNYMRDQLGPELTLDAILELHRILVEGTLDDPSAAGRLQRPGEDRVVVRDRDEEHRPVHRPPPAEELPERMELLCRFANEGEGSGHFVPPVVRAILVHFWLAYDHPFVDGNGRTARILFSWMMRNRGYWLVEYLSISRLIRAAPAQYGHAFLEVETDEGDTTYFLLHQLRLIERATADLHRYLQRKVDEQREAERILDQAPNLNGRQLALLTHATKHPDHTYTFRGHARSNRVTHETARSDLGGLVERGLLIRRRRGRAYVFEAPSDLAERLRESTP
jgi:Fic family protein